MYNEDEKFESLYANSVNDKNIEDEREFESSENFYEEIPKYHYEATPIIEEDKEKPKKKGGFAKKLGFIALVIVLAMLGGFGGSALYNYFNYQNQPIYTEAKMMSTDGVKMPVNVAEFVNEKAKDSVVAVTSLELVQGNPWTGSELREGMGSGVIISKDGYILTNSHVVSKNPKKVSVFLAGEDIELMRNQRESKQMGHPAEVIWNDSQNDLAMIKIKTDKDLKPAVLGNSDNVKVGETVIAIGNPIDVNFKGTVTQGIVSGLDRTVVVRNQENSQGGFDPFDPFSFFNLQQPQYSTNEMTGLIQTDAAINGGNSGGPLLNAKGEVIGINTVKVASSEVDSLGFAIPINNAKLLMDKVKSGEMRTVLLGVTNPYPVDEYESRLGVDLGIDGGIICMGIMKDSAAEKAGLMPNDIITSIAGKKVSSNQSLTKELQKYKVGDSVEIGIVRAGEKKTLKLTFTEWNEQSGLKVNEDDN